jgi:hypothetical protein
LRSRNENNILRRIKMSMSMNIKGFVSNKNDTYKKQAAVLMACIEAGIKELPKETADYFGEKYAEKYLLEEKLETEIVYHEYSSETDEGFEIILSEIPSDIYKIRFYNSY